MVGSSEQVQTKISGSDRIRLFNNQLAPLIESGRPSGKAEGQEETEQSEHGCLNGSDALMGQALGMAATQAIANIQENGDSDEYAE
ncbi:MAG: hypothetical protein FJ280_00640 [Planctomycetes bacterium]|nr:hypothetical protein [Planctomycetota bacterium]